MKLTDIKFNPNIKIITINEDLTKKIQQQLSKYHLELALFTQGDLDIFDDLLKSKLLLSKTFDKMYLDYNIDVNKATFINFDTNEVTIE